MVQDEKVPWQSFQKSWPSVQRIHWWDGLSMSKPNSRLRCVASPMKLLLYMQTAGIPSYKLIRSSICWSYQRMQRYLSHIPMHCIMSLHDLLYLFSQTTRKILLITHYNMIVVFSPVSIDSSLVSTDSSLVLTDSSLLAFLLLGPCPLRSKCTLVNKMCIVLYYDIILFYLVWNKYFFH